MLIKQNCKKKWWSGRMAEDYGFHGKRSRSWRWWQKTTDVLVKMSQYWSANEINAVDVLRHTAIIRESSNPPASFPKGVWEYVVTHSSHLTARGGPVYMSTPVPAPIHTDNQTNKHTDTKTDGQTVTQDTNTQTPTLLTKEVIEWIGIRHCWWIMSYLGRP